MTARLRDMKFRMVRRGQKKASHPGQVYASARKRGEDPEELERLRELAFGKRWVHNGKPRSSLLDDWDD